MFSNDDLYKVLHLNSLEAFLSPIGIHGLIRWDDIVLPPIGNCYTAHIITVMFVASKSLEYLCETFMAKVHSLENT